MSGMEIGSLMFVCSKRIQIYLVYLVNDDFRNEPWMAVFLPISPCVWKGACFGWQGVLICLRMQRWRLRHGFGHRKRCLTKFPKEDSEGTCIICLNGKLPPILMSSSPHLLFLIRGTNAATTSNGTNGSATNKQGVLGALERFYCVSVVSWTASGISFGGGDFFWWMDEFFFSVFLLANVSMMICQI